MKHCLTLVITALLTFSVIEASADKKELKKLPKTAQKFLTSNFGKDPVSEVSKEGQKATASYDAILTNGTKIKFDNDGVVKNVIPAKDSVVSNNFIPKRIIELIDKHYPGKKIVSFKFAHGFYETKFSTGGAITFDEEYNFRTINIRK